ncbi:MAG: hypothetical protein ACRDGF_08455, partial [Chloroflexota bacterium]
GFHGASPATSIGTAPPVPATSPSAFGQDAPSADTAAADTGTAAVPAPAQTGIGEPAGAAASRAGAAGLRPAAPEQDAGSGQRAGVEAAPAEAEVTATTPTVDATDVFRSMVGAVAEGAAPPAEAALSVLGDRAAERTASAAVDAGAGFEYALVDLPARLQLAGVGLAMEVRIVALTPDLALGAVTTPDAIAAEGGHRLTLPLPGVAQPLAMPVRLAGQRPDTDEQGNARQLLEIRLEWEDTAPREVLLAYYRQAQEAAIDPLQPVAANVKIEVLEGPRAGSQFLGKSSYAGRAAVQCSVDNFDVSPETRVRFSLIAPRFVEQLTLADGVVAALTPGSGRRVEVQIQFAAAHDELIAFVTKYFAERPGASLPFLSRFRRNAG